MESKTEDVDPIAQERAHLAFIADPALGRAGAGLLSERAMFLQRCLQGALDEGDAVEAAKWQGRLLVVEDTQSSHRLAASVWDAPLPERLPARSSFLGAGGPATSTPNFDGTGGPGGVH